MASTQQLLLGEGAGGAEKNYIEDVFSTYLYTGTGAALSIVNNIDLATKGGLTWIKGRSSVNNNTLFDTARGATQRLFSDSTSGQSTNASTLTSFNANGFSLDTAAGVNGSGTTFASWTFRKQPKFFDVVTYTGDGTSGRQIAHSLGSTPGCIMVKLYDTTQNWSVYHRSLGAGKYLRLNTTDAVGSRSDFGTPTSTYFEVGNQTETNANGFTYVAYIFAHDAGGFGLTGTDNVISCGSFTADGTGKFAVTLGYEPQWLLVKRTDSAQDWYLIDNMRGFANLQQSFLSPNLSAAENNLSGSPYLFPTATGFQCSQGVFGNSAQCIYIAIRRGPMKVPTDGTKVFAPIARTGTGAAATVTTGFVTDLEIIKSKASSTRGPLWFDRLRGAYLLLNSPTTDAELSDSQTVTSFGLNTGITLGSDNSPIGVNESGVNYINWGFRRAPSFFDEVCYTGSGVGTSITHNLKAVPELKIIKARGAANSWAVGGSIVSGVGGTANILTLNSTTAVTVNSTYWAAADTSSTFSVRAGSALTDTAGVTYVAYLFATCSGVSKVGSYTGNGSSQTIACGFAAGARFVMIKRTDSTGDWYVWDTARSIVSGNDPYLSLNTTAAEVTTNDTIDPDSSGFIVNQLAATNVNVNAATYIFLAIA